MDEIMVRLKEALHGLFPDILTDSITDSTRLGDDLGLDSLRMLSLSMLLEDTLGVRFPETGRFETVGELAEYIARAQAEQKGDQGSKL